MRLRKVCEGRVLKHTLRADQKTRNSISDRIANGMLSKHASNSAARLVGLGGGAEIPMTGLLRVIVLN